MRSLRAIVSTGACDIPRGACEMNVPVQIFSGSHDPRFARLDVGSAAAQLPRTGREEPQNYRFERIGNANVRPSE